MVRNCFVHAYHVPSTVTLSAWTDTPIETKDTRYMLRTPTLTPADVSQTVAAVGAAREANLRHIPIDDIVTVLDSVIQLWMSPSYTLRQVAEELLPILTGYDENVVRIELKRFLRGFRKQMLYRFLMEELPNPSVLDGFRPRVAGGLTRAFGPSLTFHVFSGNVPGLPVWSLVMSLLTKSASIGKTSSAEPLMAALFCQSIRHVHAGLADTIAILPWKRGNETLAASVYARADCVIAYGSDTSISAIRQQVPPKTRFISYGHKISFAMIGKEALAAHNYRTTLQKLADDVGVYDQQSCLSPQAVFVERGAALSPRQFAAALASELSNFQSRKPRAALSTEESIAIGTFRNQHQMSALASDDVTVYASPDSTSWTVVYHEHASFEGTPLNRTIHVYAVDDLHDALPHLQPYRAYLQTVGLAVSPLRLQVFGERLGALGVNRISAVGQMPRAAAGWHHDGRFNLLDLLHFTDIESGAESAAEWFDPDVE